MITITLTRTYIRVSQLWVSLEYTITIMSTIFKKYVPLFILVVQWNLD